MQGERDSDRPQQGTRDASEVGRRSLPAETALEFVVAGEVADQRADRRVERGFKQPGDYERSDGGERRADKEQRPVSDRHADRGEEQGSPVTQPVGECPTAKPADQLTDGLSEKEQPGGRAGQAIRPRLVVSDGWCSGA